MAYDEALAGKIRNAVSHLPCEEKKMFGHLAFMVRGKMCLTAGEDKMMCRLDPRLHDQEVAGAGCSTVIMRGRPYKGYIHIKMENLQKATEFAHWVNLALDYNHQLTVL